LKVLDSWKQRAKRLKNELVALYLAYGDPRTPWYGKAIIVCVIGYAVSPIDLIPDFIPVLGYLDDLILLPLGIILAVKMIPSEVLNECRLRVEEGEKLDRKFSWIGILLIVLVWLTVIVGIVRSIRSLTCFALF